MPDLTAQGPRPEQHWRREVPSVLSGIEPIIGRTGGDWTIPWDTLVSRQHVRVVPRGDDRVEIVVLPSARNPVFHQGKKSMQFLLVPGEHFVIGETTLMLAKRPGITNADAAPDVTEHVFAAEHLSKKRYRNSDARIDMLSRLPDLIVGSETEQELLVRVTNALLRAMPNAQAVAIVAVLSESSSPATSPADDITVLHYDHRSVGSDSVTGEPPPISARLVHAAVAQHENILHSWHAPSSAMGTFTASDAADWAFCVPLASESCPGWAIYITGHHVASEPRSVSEPFTTAFNHASTVDELQDDMKFTGLVATTLSSIRQSQQLQQRQLAMRQFFAPVVMRAIAGRDTNEVLRPREVDLCVMFCDLRGFSRSSEREADRLLELLARVSEALGVMTHHILDTGGVIGDFHGDAAMGFWGWPLVQSDAVLRAADAALRIRGDYAARQSTTEFRCGIGIASGRGVAGQIGTTDQVKVTAFGPVVNLASRLEGLTKTFGTQILVDSVTANQLRQRASSSAHSERATNSGRLRRLARVRPAGMQAVTEVFELRPDTPEDHKLLTTQAIDSYERSLQLLIDSKWSEAYELLHDLPASDRPKDVLLSLILKYNRTAPASWDGVISFPIS